MKPLLKWYNKNLKKKKRIKPAECLIVQSIFSLHLAFAESCEKRNLAAIRMSLADCRRDLTEKEFEETRETWCPYYATLKNPLEDYKFMPETESFFNSNPHCIYDYEQFSKQEPSFLQEALQIIDSI